jgi:hypothetical protein
MLEKIYPELKREFNKFIEPIAIERYFKAHSRTFGLKNQLISRKCGDGFM